MREGYSQVVFKAFQSRIQEVADVVRVYVHLTSDSLSSEGRGEREEEQEKEDVTEFLTVELLM